MKKKLYILIIVLVIIISTILIIKPKDKNNSNNHIKLAEVTHSAFYAPLYVAIENGYFKENNIDLELILTSGANNVVAAVLSGDVQIGFCGVEATIYVYSEGEKDFVQSFAGLTKKDGQFIVSRKKYDNFSLNDLKGKTVLAGRKGGMPLVNFENALKNENIDDVKINDSVDFANLTSAFIAGEGDFVNLFEPNATKLEDENLGYVVSNIGKYASLVPYTAFNAKKSFINNNKDLINRFRDSINKGIAFTIENDEKTIAKIIKDEFPDNDIETLEKIIKRYKDIDPWLENTYISEELFINLEDMLIDNDLIKKYVPFEDLIINE